MIKISIKENNLYKYNYINYDKFIKKKNSTYKSSLKKNGDMVSKFDQNYT